MISSGSSYRCPCSRRSCSRGYVLGVVVLRVLDLVVPILKFLDLVVVVLEVLAPVVLVLEFIVLGVLVLGVLVLGLMDWNEVTFLISPH